MRAGARARANPLLWRTDSHPGNVLRARDGSGGSILPCAEWPRPRGDGVRGLAGGLPAEDMREIMSRAIHACLPEGATPQPVEWL